jgi:hypothetical protein
MRRTQGFIAFTVAGLLGFASVGMAADTDGDGVDDSVDNCVTIPNGPLLATGFCDSQLDADMDGYGNACDADFDQSATTTGADYVALFGQYGTQDSIYDLDCDGYVLGTDFLRFKILNGHPPGGP